MNDDALELDRGRRLTLRAERLVYSSAPVKDAIATITKRVVTVRKTIEVDVDHEELVVTYDDADKSPFDVGTDSITYHMVLHAEEVVISKRVRVVEEIAISTTPVVVTRTFTDAVRSEDLIVEPQP